MKKKNISLSALVKLSEFCYEPKIFEFYIHINQYVLRYVLIMPVGKGRLLSFFYEWKIANYSSYVDLETGKHISSPTFKADCGSWYLELYPNGENEDVKKSISLFLALDNDKKATRVEIPARFAFSLINEKKEIIATHDTKEIKLFTDFCPGWGADFEHASLLPKNTNVKMLNELTILCEVIIEKAKLYKTILTVSPHRLRHFEKYKNLLNNPKFSDVKITVEGKEIPAHKMVLATNSIVFAATFEHKMRENEENKVTIEDVSYKVFNELLTFFYTGKCTMSKDLVSGLFEAADKYQILELKGMCEEELCKHIAVENSIAFLQLADMHSADNLKKTAIDFIALHGKEIIDRPEFDSLKNLHLDLFRDVFRVVFARVN